MAHGQNSGDDYTKNLAMVDVIFINPDYNYSTNVSGDTTEEQAREYFVGKYFNVAPYPNEKMAKVIDIKFHPKGTYAQGGTIRKVKVQVPSEQGTRYATVKGQVGDRIITDMGEFTKDDIIHDITVDKTKFMERGGEVGVAAEEFLGSRTGIRRGAIHTFVSKHNLDAVKMAQDISKGRLNNLDLATAVLGNPGNEFERAIILKYSNKMEQGGHIAIGKMHTKDGEIIGKVVYNDYWKKYQVNIDGVIYEEFNTPEEAISNLKNAGFHDLDIKKELGGILIAGAIGTAIGAGLGYGYRDSITKSKEQAIARAKKSQEEAKARVERQKAAFREKKESVKRGLISSIEKLEDGGKVGETYDITAYTSLEAYKQKRGDLIEEGIPSLSTAKRIASSERDTGFYTAVEIKDSKGNLVKTYENGGSIGKGDSYPIGPATINGVSGEILKPDAIDYHQLQHIEEGHALYPSPIGSDYFTDGKYGYAQAHWNWFKFNMKDWKNSGKKASGGKISESKKKLQDQIKTLQKAIDNTLTSDETREKMRIQINKKTDELSQLEELDKVKKLKSQNLRSKSLYLDIDKKFKTSMRNAIPSAGIPYKSKTKGNTFRIFVSNPYQLEKVLDIYNRKREEKGLKPVQESEVSNVLKKRSVISRLSTVKSRPNVKSKLSVEKKRHMRYGGSMATGGDIKKGTPEWYEHLWNDFYPRSFKERFLAKHNDQDVASEYASKPYNKLSQRMQVQWEDYWQTRKKAKI